MQTRGGQGTADELHLRVPIDINPVTALHLKKLLGEMQDERYKNKALEAAREDKKPSPPSKKRVTASDVMSEQQMFQEELLKLVERVGMIEARQKKIILVLNRLNQRFQDHVSLNSSSASIATPTTSSLGDIQSQNDMEDPDKTCLACNKVVRDCKCFD